MTFKPRLQDEKEPALQVWEVCYGQREQQAQWPRSTEPLTHFRNILKASLTGAEEVNLGEGSVKSHGKSVFPGLVGRGKESRFSSKCLWKSLKDFR